MIIAVAFSCVSTQGISVRGVVFCPEGKCSFILSRLSACGYQPFNSGSVKERGTGSRWVKEQFHFVDTSATGIKFTPFGLKRYFAFARVEDMLIEGNRLAVGFDVFVGPGDLALPGNDHYKPYSSSRAIHGFAHVTHHPALNHVITEGAGNPMTGQAALCFVKKADDLLGNNWAVRDEGLFQVIPENEVGAVMLIQAPAHGRKGRVCLDPNSIVRNEVGNTFQRGFIFRAGLVVQLPKICDERVVGL